MSSVSTFFKNAWADLVKAEHATVSAIEKAAADVPEVEAALAKYGPEVASVASVLVPSAGVYTNVAVQSAVVVGQMIEDGGAAFEKKLLDSGADQTFLADIKGLWAKLKAAAPAAPAPTPAPAKAT